MKKIGIIGLGNMGGLVAKILVEKLDGNDCLLANRSVEKAEKLVKEIGGRVVSNENMLEQASVIFLAMKPHQIRDFFGQYTSLLSRQESILFISMAAGLTLSDLQSFTSPQHRFIRIMPNTPIAVGEGIISYTLADCLSVEDEKILRSLLSDNVQLFKLDEHLMDIATAIAGCGPAFVYKFIESMSDAGVKNGLPRELAVKLSSQTVLGAGKMVRDMKEHPAVLTDQVCSPGGATIAGMAHLDKEGFNGTVIGAIEAAYQKSSRLGKRSKYDL